MDVAKATTTNAGRGTATSASQCNCWRSMPVERRNRMIMHTAEPMRPSMSTDTLTPRTMGPKASLPGRITLLRTAWKGGSSSDLENRATTNPVTPLAAVTAATRPHRAERARPVGVRYRTRAMITSHGMKMAPETLATKAAAGRLPGRARRP